MPHFDNYMKNYQKKLKLKIRNGIPDSLRGQVWLKICNIKKMREGRENLYEELISRINWNSILKIPEEDTIIKDMHRTFPKNIMFVNRLGEGQRRLYRILCCFSLRNKKAGYTQGMSFIAAIIMSYMTEEEAFWTLEYIMRNNNLQEMFYDDFFGLKKSLFVLLKYMKKFIPYLSEHFIKNNIMPTLYASGWYLTCFTNSMRFELIVRIMDCFLMEGKKIIHRFSLAILSMCQNDLLKKDSPPDIIEIIKNTISTANVDEIVKVSFGFSISKDKISEYENLFCDYINKKKTGDEDIMKLVNI